MRRLAITVLAVIIAAFRLVRRRRKDTGEVSAREVIAARLSQIREVGGLAPKGAEPEVPGGDPGPAVRDAQAAWLRDQEFITADSVIATAQKARAEITHCGAAEVRRLLDGLQREADTHPEGLPGHVVASARLRFDELMRANLQ
jgi:hypothetical protein